jgi:hypothetical protein
MASLGRLLILIGIILILLGVILAYSNLFGFLKLGRLPGDITFRRGNFTFYFPLATCLILSILITLIFYLFRK